ncbi:acyltransferase family protein [Paraburkholderia caribensis]|uniref:acyltransferase family protein n=1 Tax=Paraburkholderia caribensis TaxID=75105 RepID=UPI000AE78296|nr:acyltransferase [Paraburkholderia caribensis]
MTAVDTRVKHAGHAKEHVRGLNGLRALAVVLVFLSHKAHVETVDVGKLGVWIFFLISGFLIIGELDRNRVRVEAGNARREAVMCVFFMKRALRIFPIYYLLLLALTIAHALFYQRDVDLGLAWHYFFLSDYWIGVVKDGWPGTVSHFWSLAVEQQFYLVAPFLLVLTPASRHRAVCALVVLTGVAGHLAMHAADASEPLIYACSPLNFALLALGGLCGVLGRERGLARAAGHCSTGIIGALGVLVFATQPVWSTLALPFSAAGSAWIDIGLALSLCALFAWIANSPGSIVVSALEIKPLDYLGTISYGFYLFHNLIPSKLGFAPAWFAAPTWVHTLCALTLQFALAVLLAHLSWHLVEKRLLELKKPFEAAIARRLPARCLHSQTQPR